MSKNAVDTNKTEELIVSAPSMELAEKVRTYLLNNHSAVTWIFVYRQPDGQVDIRATNEWGARLSPELLELLQTKAAEIAGVEPPKKIVVPQETETSETSASGSSITQER